jgi:hypothetical protein
MIIDKFAIKSANYIKTKLADNFEQLNREQLQTIQRIIEELTNKNDDLSIKKLFEKNEYFEFHYVRYQFNSGRCYNNNLSSFWIPLRTRCINLKGR